MSYHTDNLTVAAALVSLDKTVAKIEVRGRKATFYFAEDLSAIALEIEMDRKLVRPMRLHQEIRRLSSLAKSMAGV